MSVVVKRFFLLDQKVSIVDLETGRQIIFDYPSDMIAWFRGNPEEISRLEKFSWYSDPPASQRKPPEDQSWLQASRGPKG